MKYALVAVMAACAGARTAPPAPAPAEPPPAPPITGFLRAAELELDRFATTPRQVLVVDGGHRAVLAYQDLLTFVDLDAPALLGPTVSLSSARVPSGLRPPFAPLRFRSVVSSLWAWDERRAALVGAVAIYSGKRASSEIAAWEPAGSAAPRILAEGDRHTDLLALSPDGGTLLIRAGSDGAIGDTLTLFDLRAARPVGASFRTGTVDSAAFSPDGAQIALALADGSLVLLTARTGTTTTLSPRGEPFRHAAFHPTRPLLLVSDGARMQAWDLGVSPPASTAYNLGPVFAFTPDGRHVAVGRSATVELYEVATMTRVGAPHVPSVPRGAAIHLAFSADGRRLVAVWQTRAISVLDLGVVETPVTPAWFARVQRLAVPDPEAPPPFARDGWISGRVLVAGAAMAGAVVQLRPAAREWPDALALPPQEVRTDSGGRYTFTGVARIDWTVAVTLPGHVGEPRDVGLRDAPSAEVDLPMVPVMKLSGKVVGPRGKIAGTRVRVVTSAIRRRPTEVMVGRDGRFTVDDLASGTVHTVWANGPGGTAGFAEVLGRAPAAGVTIALRPPGAAGVLRVRAVSRNGAPVAGAWLMVRTPPHFHSAITGDDGTYTFAVPPGTRHVVIMAGPPTMSDQVIALPFPHEVEIVVPDELLP